MGKGARLRAERRQQAEAERSMDLVGRLFEIEDRETFVALVESEPAFRDGRVAAEIRRLQALPGFAALYEPAIQLVERAGQGDDLGTAWEDFSHVMAEQTRQAEELEPKQRELDAAGERGDWPTVISLTDELIPKAEELGLGVAVGVLRGQRMKALVSLEDTDRASNLEEAIRVGELAIEVAPAPDVYVDFVMTLGITYMERLAEDPRQNLERAVELLSEALRVAEDLQDHNLIAITQTNLANAYHRRQEGDPVENQRRARELCEAALEWRNPERDTIDWAHTQATYGVVLEEAAWVGDRDRRPAITAYEALIAEADRLPTWLAGRSHAALGAVHWREARDLQSPSFEELDDGLENGDEFELTPEEQAVVEEHLRAGEEHLRRARDLTDPHERPIDFARLSRDLGALLRSIESDDAVDIAREGLTYVDASNAPRLCLELGFNAGQLLATAGRWNEAAEAFVKAKAAADLLFHGRLATDDRGGEMQRAGNVARWTSYALGEIGRAEDAVLALESGRARELRRRIGADAVDGLDPELAAAYADAAETLRSQALGDESEPAARHLQSVIAEIRRQPGFERFQMDPMLSEIAGASREGWPLAYVNPTPWGVQLLVVRNDGLVESASVASTGSLEILFKVMTEDIESEDSASYLGAIGDWKEESSDDEVAAALDYLLPWLGERIAHPLAQMVEREGLVGLSLVACGALSLVPLHAATWEEHGRTVSLLDRWPIRFAPSAAVIAGCLDDAERRADLEVKVRAIGNPDWPPPLESAELEAQVIADLLGGGPTDLAIGPTATRAFLAAGDSDVTHLHLACHAAGSVVDLDETAIYLSDGPLSGAELGSVLSFRPRLTVVSACQSAMPNIAGHIEEGLSIATAFLAAGSAAAIATLWPVDDRATALLMIRFYESLAASPARDPATLLRETQLWLRDLDADNAEEILARYPELLRALRERRNSDPGLHFHAGAEPEPEFTAYHWAGFVMTGA